MSRPGQSHKYHVRSRQGDYAVDKSDPFAFQTERPPRTASIVTELTYDWDDAVWLEQRARVNALDAPWSIYEVHLGSWRRVLEEKNRSLTYRELAPCLVDYVTQLGFTHVELLPVMEHPFYGSWGYQVTGYFAPTARYGSPQDLMFLVEQLHRNGICVIFDWVPSHFPTDEHALGYFDGTHLYEHADPRQGHHPEWNSSIFNYGRPEVRDLLGSSALFWLDIYRADALRVDAVASMLYLDYARREGEWVPNRHGGRENLDAVAFLRAVNQEIYRTQPAAQTIAGGVHRLAPGLAAELSGRTRIRAQMEHGVDARHPQVLSDRSDLSQVSAERADLLSPVRVQRELRPAALTR